MTRHFTPVALNRLLSGPADEAEMTRALEHLLTCRHCWATAADALWDKNLGGHPTVSLADSRRLLVALIEEGANRAVETLKARAWWSEIKALEATEQIRRVRSVAALRTLAFFDVLVGDARQDGMVDPFRGENIAQLAYAVAELLPHTYSKNFKVDLQGEALITIANCRRISADWPGTAKALEEAGRHVAQGTGDPGLQARLLSIQCSYLTDIGDMDSALPIVRRAIVIYSSLEDWQNVAHNLVKEAGCLMANSQYGEAIERAAFAQQRIPAHDIRLQALTRFIMIECLVVLGKPLEALRVFVAGKAIFGQSTELSMRLRASYVEARLLDSLGSARESERLFRNAISDYFDHELYKDGFIVLLTLFECLCRRGASRKASALCEAAIAATTHAGEACSSRIREAWEELHAAVRSRKLTDSELDHARRFLIRNWSLPEAGAGVLPEVRAADLATRIPPPEPPPPVPLDEPLGIDSYQASLDAYDRVLIAKGLKQANGSIREAARLLGLSRNGLRTKIRRYGL